MRQLDGRIGLARDLADRAGDELCIVADRSGSGSSQPIALLAESGGGTMLGVLRVVIVPALHAAEIIDSLLAIVHMSVAVKWIVVIAVAVRGQTRPGDKAAIGVLWAKVIAEVVRTVSGLHPEVNEQIARRNHDGRTIGPAGLGING